MTASTARRPVEEDERYLGPCPICRRPMLRGASVNRHHFVPKSRGGREARWLHRVCHSKIHTLFSEAELERHFDEPEKLLTDPEMQRFVTWLLGKPAEFWTRNARPRRSR